MVLSATDIQFFRPLYPIVEKSQFRGMSYGLSYCGYDIRVKKATFTDSNGDEEQWCIYPGEFLLASSLERFQMPNHIVGIVHDKSTWARKGLTVQNTVIEPGWEGYLTLELTNHSTQPLRMFSGDPIAQVLFHYISNPMKDGYDGKYQDQPDRPVKAKHS